jgi:hypothetical protein
MSDGLMVADVNLGMVDVRKGPKPCPAHGLRVREGVGVFIGRPAPAQS